MLKQILFYPVVGAPFFVVVGMLGFIFVLAAAVVAILITKGIYRLPISLHVWLARIAILLGIIHGLGYFVKYF
ncbi:MAG: hypothetical protein WC310_00360 [Patescibacteria group bacterium]|jgi:predicted lysophospholipase L1 biosynthesis ABC-type transport system permease subunit